MWIAVLYPLYELGNVAWHHPANSSPKYQCLANIYLLYSAYFSIKSCGWIYCSKFNLVLLTLGRYRSALFSITVHFHPPRTFLCNTATDDITSALRLAHLSHQEISQIAGHILDIACLNYLLLHNKTVFGKGKDWCKLIRTKCGIAFKELQELHLGHSHMTICLRIPSKCDLCLPVFIPVMQSSNNLPM